MALSKHYQPAAGHKPPPAHFEQSKADKESGKAKEGSTKDNAKDRKQQPRKMPC